MRFKRGASKTNAQGFTLMEILVALMVLSISMTVILQLFSGGLRSEKMSEDYQQALFYAKEAMEEILLRQELQEGTFSGAFDEKYNWTMEITADKPLGISRIKTLYPFYITMNVNWLPGRGGKHFSLTTLHIAKKKVASEQ